MSDVPRLATAAEMSSALFRRYDCHAMIHHPGVTRDDCWHGGRWEQCQRQPSRYDKQRRKQRTCFWHRQLEDDAGT